MNPIENSIQTNIDIVVVHIGPLVSPAVNDLFPGANEVKVNPRSALLIEFWVVDLQIWIPAMCFEHPFAI